MIFNFPLHAQSTKYPETGIRIQLGSSYQYAAAPVAPDQRVITLSFNTMRYIESAPGVVDITTTPEINFGRLIRFYERHKLWAVFMYPHPMFGPIPCRFNKGLQIPKGNPGGTGTLQPFELELVEVPGFTETFGDEL